MSTRAINLDYGSGLERTFRQLTLSAPTAARDQKLLSLAQSAIRQNDLGLVSQIFPEIVNPEHIQSACSLLSPETSLDTKPLVTQADLAIRFRKLLAQEPTVKRDKKLGELLLVAISNNAFYLGEKIIPHITYIPEPIQKAFSHLQTHCQTTSIPLPQDLLSHLRSAERTLLAGLDTQRTNLGTTTTTTTTTTTQPTHNLQIQAHSDLKEEFLAIIRTNPTDKEPKLCGLLKEAIVQGAFPLGHNILVELKHPDSVEQASTLLQELHGTFPKLPQALKLSTQLQKTLRRLNKHHVHQEEGVTPPRIHPSTRKIALLQSLAAWWVEVGPGPSESAHVDRKLCQEKATRQNIQEVCCNEDWNESLALIDSLESETEKNRALETLATRLAEELKAENLVDTFLYVRQMPEGREREKLFGILVLEHLKAGSTESLVHAEEVQKAMTPGPDKEDAWLSILMKYIDLEQVNDDLIRQIDQHPPGSTKQKAQLHLVEFFLGQKNLDFAWLVTEAMFQEELEERKRVDEELAQQDAKYVPRAEQDAGISFSLYQNKARLALCQKAIEWEHGAFAFKAIAEMAPGSIKNNCYLNLFDAAVRWKLVRLADKVLKAMTVAEHQEEKRPILFELALDQEAFEIANEVRRELPWAQRASGKVASLNKQAYLTTQRGLFDLHFKCGHLTAAYNTFRDMSEGPCKERMRADLFDEALNSQDFERATQLLDKTCPQDFATPAQQRIDNLKQALATQEERFTQALLDENLGEAYACFDAMLEGPAKETARLELFEAALYENEFRLAKEVISPLSLGTRTPLELRISNRRTLLNTEAAIERSKQFVHKATSALHETLFPQPSQEKVRFQDAQTLYTVLKACDAYYSFHILPPPVVKEEEFLSNINNLLQGISTPVRENLDDLWHEKNTPLSSLEEVTLLQDYFEEHFADVPVEQAQILPLQGDDTERDILKTLTTQVGLLAQGHEYRIVPNDTYERGEILLTLSRLSKETRVDICTCWENTAVTDWALKDQKLQHYYAETFPDQEPIKEPHPWWQPMTTLFQPREAEEYVPSSESSEESHLVTAQEKTVLQRMTGQIQEHLALPTQSNSWFDEAMARELRQLSPGLCEEIEEKWEKGPQDRAFKTEVLEQYLN